MKCLLRSQKMLGFLAMAVAILALARTASAVVLEFSPEVTDGDIHEFAISPDGTQIAFLGSLDNGLGDQTYVAPIGGGAATLVSPDGVPAHTGPLAWLPDGSAVASRNASSGNNEFYLLPPDGSQTATQITFNNTDAFDPQFNADGSLLFYSDNTDADKLYVRPTSSPSTTPAIQLTPDALAEMDPGSYAQAGSDIIFAGFSTPVMEPGNGTAENAFYRTAADGSTAATPTLIPVNNFPTDFTADIDFMAVTPDEQTIIFRGDLTSDGVDEIYSLPIEGGDFTPLLPPGSPFNFDLVYFAISPDGSTIAFHGDYNENQVGELYVIPITGGTPFVVNDPHQTAGSDVSSGVDKIVFSSDSKSIYYVADSRVDGTFELFRVSNPIPEPTSILLLVSAAAILGLRKR